MQMAFEGILEYGIIEHIRFSYFTKKVNNQNQTLWSNSKELVDKQQTLFNKMWDIAISLSVRNKELKYQQVPQYRDTLTNSSDIKAEISSVVQQCREELLIFSSVKLLNLLLLAPGGIECNHGYLTNTDEVWDSNPYHKNRESNSIWIVKNEEGMGFVYMLGSHGFIPTLGLIVINTYMKHVNYLTNLADDNHC